MASLTGTPVVVTDAGTVLADTHTASAAGLELALCVAERGTTGTSPSVLTYGGVNALANPITALIGTASGQRVHRWYRIPKASHPGTGTHVVACTWAGVDNIAVAILEISSTGTLSYPSSNQAASGTVAITAGSGDLTIGCAQGNSATPAFAPVNGQTEYLESVWFASSGHVVGVQTGVQTAASWTGAGSICASAFVVHEESSGSDYGVATETDAAVALVGSAHATYGVTAETDAAIALTGSNPGAYGVATETDSAVALTATNQAAFGVSTETDAAVALAGVESVAYGVATETDSAIALETGDIYPGVSLETDSAVALVGSDHATYGTAAETGASVALVGSAHAAYAISAETDSAVALAGSLAAAYGIATETDLAVALTVPSVHTLAPALFTFRDPAATLLFADAQEPTTYRDESAATIAYD